jgi:hypothetical protein
VSLYTYLTSRYHALFAITLSSLSRSLRSHALLALTVRLYPFRATKISVLSQGDWKFPFISSVLFRINHLLQEVEQVDGHAHAEIDGVSRLDEVEGPQVRIFKSFTNLKTDLQVFCFFWGDLGVSVRS